MTNFWQITGTSIVQAFLELKANKLRTFLSLLGITIGIFCIISVLTVLDSLKNNIQKDMATLGSNVLYVGRWPWMDDGTEYKWWEYWRRPGMTPQEVRAIEANVPDVAAVTLCLSSHRITVKYNDAELSSIAGYAVLNYFDKVQNIDIQLGRYLSSSEIDGGNNAVVLGYAVYRNLFGGNTDPLGKNVSFLGKKFNVVGVMKKAGQNMAGFDYDNSVVFPYYSAATVLDVHSLNYDPILAVKAADGKDVDEVKYEVEGVLRRMRKVRPGQPNDFAINQLSQVSERLNMVFGTIDIVGWFIGGLSLLVGAFGIANIMFVTVRERTRIIGLKKAIGAKNSSVLLEFLLEAVVLSLIGGVAGIMIVMLISLILTYGFEFEVILSLSNFFIGIFVSIFVGVLAGIIPAVSASKLDPVVAIRSN
ncbi:ABC transporter permease [Nemorincola caseinilytica]|uniref:ABC transporter permease n=1 Tax=Nemorincola caseinilytica TaxID=2054315 RepID=A0ABP8NM00_9BACT